MKMLRKIHPNFISSLSPFIFGPIIVYSLTHTPLATEYLVSALVFMVLGGVADFLDGFHARATNQVSNLGKLYDPMCDSIFHLTIWIAFSVIGWIPVWFVLIFLIRESVISTMRTYMAVHHIVLAARLSGKMKTLSQCILQPIIVLLHLTNLSDNFIYWGQIAAVSIAAAITALSFLDYLDHFYVQAREKKFIIN
jgi:CDP-diacylglycerol--glycerol-3-phosphate 3-phosphatidyltransferase